MMKNPNANRTGHTLAGDPVKYDSEGNRVEKKTVRVCTSMSYRGMPEVVNFLQSMDMVITTQPWIMEAIKEYDYEKPLDQIVVCMSSSFFKRYKDKTARFAELEFGREGLDLTVEVFGLGDIIEIREKVIADLRENRSKMLKRLGDLIKEKAGFMKPFQVMDVVTWWRQASLEEDILYYGLDVSEEQKAICVIDLFDEMKRNEIVEVKVDVDGTAKVTDTEFYW